MSAGGALGVAPERGSRRRVLVAASLVVALAGLGLFVAGCLVDARAAWFAYLDAWVYGVSICEGALLLLMTDHVSKGSWMLVTRRASEAVVTALPLYLLLFVPLALAVGLVYPWAGAQQPLPDLEGGNRVYLTRWAFDARTLLYFAIFILIGGSLRGLSLANDARPRLALVHRMRVVGGGGLPVVALVLTWAAFDWTMSLEPEWWSTIHGLYTFAGAFVGAIALVGVMVAILARSEPQVAARVTPDHAQALGRLLFAMTIFWAYMAFSQLLIYWIGDLPQEISFYATRAAGSWAAVDYVLVFGHFFIPFFVLLNRRWKRSWPFLAAAGVWMLVMHWVDVAWLVFPTRDPGGLRARWFDPGPLLLVGGASCAWITLAYTRAAPFPRHAPELVAGFEYEASV